MPDSPTPLLPRRAPAPRITIERSADLAPPDAAAVRTFLTGIFQPADDDVYAEPQHILRVWVGDEWVGVVEIVDHTIAVGGRAVRIGGIGGVSTSPTHRRRGYASAAMAAAARFAFEELGVPFAMLFCADAMVPFYERLDWRRVERRCRYVGRGGREAFDDLFMFLAPDGADFPAGEIDLLGPQW